MKAKWARTAIWLLLALGLVLAAPPQRGLGYSNYPPGGSWEKGGPHRTINELALERFIEQAKSDPVLSKYNFNKEVLKVKGPRIGEPGTLVRGNLLGLEDKFETFQWWVIEGGYSADEPELYASFRHFYDPRAKEMGRPPYLTDHLDELGEYFKVVASVGGWAGPMLNEIGQNPEVDARDWAINGSENKGWGENEYSWKKGVEYMSQAFESTDAVEKSKYFAQAWRALGETMHLSADMTVPAHVRNDSHPAVSITLSNPDPNVGFLKADPYEKYVQADMIRNVGRASVEPEMQDYINQSNDALDLFERVALFTNAGFFSADTVSGIDPATGDAVHSANGMPDYPSPSLEKTQYDGKTGNYTKTIGSKDVCLAHRSWLSKIGWGSAEPWITSRCVKSQAQVLIPVAVAGNAKLLDWFIPRVKVEITEVDTDNHTLRGSFTHEPDGAYKTEMNFSTAADAFNPFYLNGSPQDWDDYKLEVKNGDITLTYGDTVALNIENARASGKAGVSLTIDMGGIEVRSNDFPLTKTSPTPTPKVTPTTTAQAKDTGEWVLQSIIPEPPYKKEDSSCYFDNQVSIGDGSFTSSMSWTDEGCRAEGGPYYSGSVSETCSWTAPPSYLKVGSVLTLSAECQSTAQQTGGGRFSGGWGTMRLTLNPPEDNLGGNLTWSNTFLGDVKASGWTGDFPVSGSLTGSIEIPQGKNGDVLVIVGSWQGPGGSGVVIYKYVYGATGPVPERAQPPGGITPVPITATATPTATPEATPTAPPEATPTAPPEATATGTAEVTATPTPSAAEEEFFRVASLGVAYNGATEPTTFSIDESWLVTYILTYHWNNASGATPGTIGLRASDGTTYGPWQATGEPGSGGVPNAYWVVKPNIVIPPGTYTVLDSDPSTWAQNEETGGAGISWGNGIRQGNP